MRVRSRYEVAPTPDEDLSDDRFSALGGVPDVRVVGRDVPPPEQVLAFLGDDVGEQLLDLGPFLVSSRGRKIMPTP